MAGVDQKLRYIKFAKQRANGDRSQVLIVTTAMNMEVRTTYKIMKADGIWKTESLII